MRRMIDVHKVATKWVDYNKGVTTEDRANASAWAQVNAQIDNRAMLDALTKTYGAGWAFGQADAQIELGATVNANFWDNWSPGNEGAAALVDPPNGLRDLLDRAGVDIKGMDATTYDRMGSVLAVSLSQGMGADETARLLSGVVNDPARAMVIARTETARAVVQSNLAEYKDAGVSQLEWLVADPCEICAENDGEIVNVGDEFPSGDEYPPAHPNCVCDVAPVIEELNQPDVTDTTDGEPVDGEDAGVTEVSPDGEDTVIHDGVVDESPTVEPEPSFDFEPAKLTPEQMDAELSGIYKSLLEKYNGDYDTLEGLRKDSPNDKIIEAMWEKQGFNALPKLVSDEQLATLVEKGWQPIFRGIAADTPELVDKFIADFKTGETPFGGKGMFGNGTYAGSESTAENFATKTANGDLVEHGQVMNMAINPEANYVSVQTLQDDWKTWISEVRAYQSNVEKTYDYWRVSEPINNGGMSYPDWLKSLPDDVRAKYNSAGNQKVIYEDFGKFATSRGYDGYYIENPNVNAFTNDAVQDTYYVILNRGTVAIAK